MPLVTPSYLHNVCTTALPIFMHGSLFIIIGNAAKPHTAILIILELISKMNSVFWIVMEMSMNGLGFDVKFFPKR